ncbi:hypothetical protein [Agromyces ramosus]|uniref:Uncharacterized protein n=1 Tax=Agromyces ramosus TaxID=33879 RepID=A0ABU0R5H3_9MICO|nr:hypothetical protein [Agromyces ramosus]MDQ0893341.1 hypothetical protein [Agromyces ramosus]
MRESISPVSRALTLDQIRTLLDLVPDGVYSRAREGVALRAGAALNDALKSAAGEPPNRTRRRAPVDLNGTLMAQPRRDTGGITR